MRALGTLPMPRGSRWSLTSVVLFGVMLFAAYEAAAIVLSGEIVGLATIALLFAAAALAVAILNDWRRGVFAFVGWLCFEDFARKYLGNNMVIYFGKDFLVLLLYLSFFRARRLQKLERFRIPFRAPLLILVWFGVLQMFNPGSPSIFYGLLGMKVYFLYVPLIFIGYALVETEQDLHRYFSFWCVLVLIVSGLGIAQSILGPSFLNPAHLQDDIRELATTYRIAPSGVMAYRPTSVFVSGGRFQDFLVVSWIIALGYGGFLLLRQKQGRALAFTTIGVIASASVMSASRGVFMWNLGVGACWAAGFLWGAPWKQREVRRVLRAFVRALIAVIVGIVALVALFPKDVGSRFTIYYETLLPNSPTSELVNRTHTYPITQFINAFNYPQWPYGYGIGTYTLGTQYVVRLLHAPPMKVGVESGYGSLILELGIVGLLLWIILGIAISRSAWKVVTHLRGAPWFPLAFTSFLFASILYFPMTYTSFTASQDFVVSANLWLILGILFRIDKFGQPASAGGPSIPAQ